MFLAPHCYRRGTVNKPLAISNTYTSKWMPVAMGTMKKIVVQ